MTGRVLAGFQAGGASGPAAGVSPGAGEGMRGAAGAVAPHAARAEALPRLLLGTARSGAGAPGQPRAQRHPEPGPLRQQQRPGGGGRVEELQQFGIGGPGVERIGIAPPPPDLACAVRRAVIATESLCGLVFFFF